jgi:hypothetical protein
VNTPQILTRSMRATTAAVRFLHWSKRFGYEFPWFDTAALIEKLGPQPNPDDVDAVVGNDSWTRLECDVCGGTVDAVSRFHDGAPDDHEADDWKWEDVSVLDVCLPCLERACDDLKAALGQDQASSRKSGEP